MNEMIPKNENHICRSTCVSGACCMRPRCAWLFLTYKTRSYSSYLIAHNLSNIKLLCSLVVDEFVEEKSIVVGGRFTDPSLSSLEVLD